MDRHSDARSSCNCAIHGTASSCCPGIFSSEPSMYLSVNSTTGTRFELSLPREETVEGLKRRLAQKLRVPKERLALLHKDTRLTSGKLQDFGVTSGSKVTLVPSLEAGLMSQTSRPEQSIMQALEGLTETQVNDFLCGRSPLTLALRVGDHMMFVQLQLAAQQQQQQQQQSAHRHPTARGPSGTHGATLGSSPTGRSPPHPRAQPHGQGPVMSEGPASTPVSHSSATPCPQSECSSRTPPTGSQGRKPGAVIESFVNHAPGVFSGTFSGTLHPSCQDGSGRPRRDISTVLQILNDLLNATRHYQTTPPSPTGAPAATPTLCPRRRTPQPHTHSSSSSFSSPPPSPSPSLSPSLSPPASPRSHTHTVGLQQQHGRTTGSDGERQCENRATRCKVEHLQMLLQQHRLRRKARRDSRAPYAWSPSNRRVTRSHSNSSAGSASSASSASSPSSSAAASPDGDAASLELEYEDAVWKAEGPPTDLSSEVIMA